MSRYRPVQSTDTTTRLLRGVLALCLLMAQAGWLEHLYHQHDLNHDEVCEFCLVGHAQDHAATDSDGYTLRIPTYLSASRLTESDLIGRRTSYYLSRAPPHYL